jgi:hypothetical protein
MIEVALRTVMGLIGSAKFKRAVSGMDPAADQPERKLTHWRRRALEITVFHRLLNTRIDVCIQPV